MSLLNYRQALVDASLAAVWRQWTLLGVPGYEVSSGDEHRILDPESLLLFTSALGRFDARLLDEAIHWLQRHGKLINIQRLKNIQQQFSLGNREVLSAIAATILSNSRLAKWQTIKTVPKEGEEPLFLNRDGIPLPVFGPPDPNFAKFGYYRGKYHPRDDATAPHVEHADLLLVKLRALFGVNARAEIIAMLLVTPSCHPSALARRTGYLPRSVQDILNEMALSGHVLSARPGGSREKYFSLRPEDWDFLITWTPPEFPRWGDWALRFSLIQSTLDLLYSNQPMSDSAVALRLRGLLDRYYPALSEAGIAQHFSQSLPRTGIGFLEVFLKEMIRF